MGFVVWDYHVILIHSKSEKQSYVYDFDSIYSFPVKFEEYCLNSFKEEPYKIQFHYQFRVIKAQEFLQTFASDRSRMKYKDGTFMKPPPNYDCIQTLNEIDNLNMFISMDQSFPIGQIMNFKQLLQQFSTK